MERVTQTFPPYLPAENMDCKRCFHRSGNGHHPRSGHTPHTGGDAEGEGALDGRRKGEGGRRRGDVASLSYIFTEYLKKYLFFRRYSSE